MSIPDADAIVEAARAGLAARADPTAAPGMQAYMKSAMPFRGVAAPGRGALCCATLRPLLADRVRCRGGGRACSGTAPGPRGALRRHRAGPAARAGSRTGCGLRHWIVTGAWWDHVDEIASRLVGPRCAPTPYRLRRCCGPGPGRRTDGCAARR